VALTSRSRATFQSELIEQSTKDKYPDYIKGAAVYKSFDEQEGYYVFDKDLQEYIPIHYLEDKCIWVLIDYDDKVGSWFTTGPTPLEYGLGPYRSKPIHGIDIDLSEGEFADTKEPEDKGKQLATPTPTFYTYSMSTQTQAQTTTTSVAMAQADVFAILGNKIVKNLRIFVEVDYLRSWGVLCQP